MFPRIFLYFDSFFAHFCRRKTMAAFVWENMAVLESEHVFIARFIIAISRINNWIQFLIIGFLMPRFYFVPLSTLLHFAREPETHSSFFLLFFEKTASFFIRCATWHFYDENESPRPFRFNQLFCLFSKQNGVKTSFICNNAGDAKMKFCPLSRPLCLLASLGNLEWNGNIRFNSRFISH